MTMLPAPLLTALALLPAVAALRLTDGGSPTPDAAGKADPSADGVVTEREDVLAMLEEGFITTEEALDLLDGMDQTRSRTAAGSGVPASSPQPPPFVAGLEGAPMSGRPPRAQRPTRAGRFGVNLDVGPRPDATGATRSIRFIVNDRTGSTVNLALPIAFLDVGLKVVERYRPGLMDGAVGQSIRQAVGSGRMGTILEVNDATGDHVRIAIE